MDTVLFRTIIGAYRRYLEAGSGFFGLPVFYFIPVIFSFSFFWIKYKIISPSPRIIDSRSEGKFQVLSNRVPSKDSDRYGLFIG
jgi:hypothetical protein